MKELILFLFGMVFLSALVLGVTWFLVQLSDGKFDLKKNKERDYWDE